MFEYEMHNCLPEYFRLQQEQYEHECELKYERHKHYKGNIKKLENAEKAGYPILQYDGYVTCQGCANADFNTCPNSQFSRYESNRTILMTITCIW